MRQFQKVLQDLKGIVTSHRPGETLARPAAMSFIDVNGMKVAYAESGESQENQSPVVLLHGFGGFFMDWPRVIMPISKHTKVYALDLPGWGFSDPHPDARSMEDDVRVLNEFLIRNELHDVIICGLSYGAGVAWAAAAQNLVRVKQYVLLNPMPPSPMKYMRSPLYRTIFRLNTIKPLAYWGHRFMNKAQYKLICRENLLNHRLLDTFYLDLAYLVIKQPKVQANLSAHANAAKNLKWEDYEHKLAGVRKPVSILQGLDDRIFSLASATYLHRLIPTSELIEVEQCGHAMVFDQHRKVSDFIIRNLEIRRENREPLKETVRQG